jgi:lipoprotein LprG
LELVSGIGDIVRTPVSIQGTFTLAEEGIQVSAKVAAVGNTFEAQLPFHSGYEKTNPASFGLTNPAQLLNSQSGLTSLLALAQNPHPGRQTRLNGEVLDTVDFTVPGRSVPVIPDEAPARPVDLAVGIDPSSYQLRTVTLTGPFTSVSANSTYVVTLTNYNEHVTVVLPPTTS